MQQGKGIVVIGGVSYSIGEITQNGFEVIKPRAAHLDVEHLHEVMRTNAQTLKKTFGETAYQDIRGFCADCLAAEQEKAAITVVARKFANGRYSYKGSWECQGKEGKVIVKEFIFLETFVDFDGMETPPSSRKPVAKPTQGKRRSGAHAYA